jgi:hypothetical protein
MPFVASLQPVVDLSISVDPSDFWWNLKPTSYTRSKLADRYLQQRNPNILSAALSYCSPAAVLMHIVTYLMAGT